MINITKIYLVENCYGDPNKVYIGKTKNNRKYNHSKTYGSQITYTYIDKVNSINHNDWEPLETYWIEQFRQWGFQVMNKNKGGSGPDFQTEETKQKISNSTKGKNTWSKGRIVSEEIKQNISNINKNNKYNVGKTRSDKHKKILSDLFKGIPQTEETKLKRSISAKGKPKPPDFGKNHSLKMKDKKRPHQNKAIKEINSNQIYNSIKECAEILNINTHNIIHVLRNRSKQTKQGYIFKYI